MPERKTLERAQEDAREGKSPSTQAGEFVREEFHHVRDGKHGARSPQQAVAIGLSKARRAGVKLPPPKRGPASMKLKAEQDLKAARHSHRGQSSATRSRAVLGALERESKATTRREETRWEELSRPAKSSAPRRGSRNRTSASRKAARTRRAA